MTVSVTAWASTLYCNPPAWGVGPMVMGVVVWRRAGRARGRVGWRRDCARGARRLHGYGWSIIRIDNQRQRQRRRASQSQSGLIICLGLQLAKFLAPGRSHRSRPKASCALMPSNSALVLNLLHALPSSSLWMRELGAESAAFHNRCCARWRCLNALNYLLHLSSARSRANVCRPRPRH
jgi:hypothetical protein